jgi:peptide/nickel transport system ATP-binding protein
VCGWEGHDLVEAIEQRWTQVDREQYEHEQRLVGDLDKVEVHRQTVRFPASEPARLQRWLAEVAAQLPSGVHQGVAAVEAADGAVEVRFRSGPAPAVQQVAGRDVACHLHGVVPRPDGVHVGDPAEASP